MKILFLDDDEIRQRKFRSGCPWADIVETAEEAITALQKTVYHIVCLDHDLGGEIYVNSEREDTGMGVVRWIVANRPAITMVIVHSLNTDGSQQMVEALQEAEYDATRIPFIKFNDDIYEQFSNFRDALQDSDQGSS